MPDHHERLFLDYLEYLRCLSQKRYTLIDVKYNTTHFLTRPWQERGAPYLLELIVKHGLYVLNVTRRNYLRYILSSEKAWHTNRYRCRTVTQPTSTGRGTSTLASCSANSPTVSRRTDASSRG